MIITNHCFWEHNADDTLLWSVTFPGAYARGKNLDEAIEKITDLLRNTKISMDEIGKLFEVSQGTITRINTGKVYKRNIDYPIRKNKPVSTMAGQAASRDTINTCLCFRKRST